MAGAVDDVEDALYALAAKGSRLDSLKCTCDFCTGKKKHEENWCARCADVRLGPGKHWENLDVCEKCEDELSKLTEEEKQIRF